MKKFLKGLVITLLVIAAIYFVPRIIMWNMINKMPDTEPIKYLTDYTLADEKTYEISEGDITMRIPSYYASTNVREYYAVVCDARLKNRELLIYYKPLETILNKLAPGSSKDYTAYVNSIRSLNDSKPGYPMNMFFDIPDDFFETVKYMYLADKSTYDFWNLTDALELNYYLKARQKVDAVGDLTALYERDDVRAIIIEYPEFPGEYMVMIIPKYNEEVIYGFSIKTSDLDDVTKLLNTFEYNSGL